MNFAELWKELKKDLPFSVWKGRSRFTEKELSAYLEGKEVEFKKIQNQQRVWIEEQKEQFQIKIRDTFKNSFESREEFDKWRHNIFGRIEFCEEMLEGLS